ncbi:MULTISPECIES: IS110 family RNA-guided transposase [Bacillus]|uniref:IS110 family transposase n=1 Tax=Bacillus TaxID=1386 RepID=UPI000BB73485|nr:MULTISPECIES: IS110 family transposase [Bacillus]
MEVIHPRVCGLDVHKNSITACIIIKRKKEIRTFGTMTDDLLELLDWIQENQCPIVAMESTGVYWKPIYNLLEVSDIEALVVNAQHIKNVPGRKSDVRDAQWIAQLLQHGLINGSFIPNREQRELRELVRYRRSLIEETARESNRIQKVLEGANIKLGSVASNVLGVSGRKMLRALIEGNLNPEILAEMSLGALRKKIPALQKALKGLVGTHQQFLLARQLDHVEYLEKQIEFIDKELAERLSPSSEEINLVMSIPGIGKRTAEQILAEVGTDMSRFNSDNHLASWAGMVPGENESAGKKKSARTRKGNKYLRSALVEAAKTVGRSKNFFGAKYRRIKARRGGNIASVAIGRCILIAVYHILITKKPFQDLGEDYHLNRKKDQEVKRAIKRIEKLGYSVEISELPA